MPVGCDRNQRDLHVRQDCAGRIRYRAGDAARVRLTERSLGRQKEQTEREKTQYEPTLVSCPLCNSHFSSPSHLEMGIILPWRADARLLRPKACAQYLVFDGRGSAQPV